MDEIQGKCDPSCLVFLTVIAGRKLKSALLESISAEGGRLMNVIYAKGTVNADYIRETLGLIPEEDKVIITSLISSKKVDSALNMLITKFHFDKPNTGIAYTTTLSGTSL